LRSDNLDSVGELYTEHDFGQLIVTIEVTPAFLGGSASLKIMASLSRKLKVAQVTDVGR
jgi:hypothetical protein